MGADNVQRQKTIGVICAPTPGINPGMTSVDLAFHAVARRNDFGDVRYFQLFDSAEYATDFPESDQYRSHYFRDYPLHYRRLLDRRDELLACDAIVFWGDWTHMALYCRSIVAPSLAVLKIVADEREAIELMRAYFFLADQPKAVLQKTISFGETLIFNSPRDELDIYGELDARLFFSGLRSIYMRDIVSASKVRQLSGRFDSACLGVDCAMLLTRSDHDWMPQQDAAPHAQRDEALVYFGRSDYSEQQQIDLVNAITERTALSPRWLDWGSPFAFPQAKRPLFPIRDENHLGTTRIGDQMRQIEQASLVITDTYHLCVNAWRMGVPAICVGGSSPASGLFDLNAGHSHAACDKRFVLYTMIGALDFYIQPHEMGDRERLEKRVAHVAERVRDAAVVEHIYAGIRASARAAEQALADDLHALLRQPAGHATALPEQQTA